MVPSVVLPSWVLVISVAPSSSVAGLDGSCAVLASSAIAGVRVAMQMAMASRSLDGRKQRSGVGRNMDGSWFY
ncbi:conserved hypothetical protein [Pseudomonas sp. IT-P12]